MGDRPQHRYLNLSPSIKSSSLLNLSLGRKNLAELLIFAEILKHSTSVVEGVGLPV
jgi:hypothetical protein